MKPRRVRCSDPLMGRHVLHFGSVAHPTMMQVAQSIAVAAVRAQDKNEAAKARNVGRAELLEFPAGSRTL